MILQNQHDYCIELFQRQSPELFFWKGVVIYVVMSQRRGQNDERKSFSSINDKWRQKELGHKVPCLVMWDRIICVRDNGNIDICNRLGRLRLTRYRRISKRHKTSHLKFNLKQKSCFRQIQAVLNNRLMSVSLSEETKKNYMTLDVFYVNCGRMIFWKRNTCSYAMFKNKFSCREFNDEKTDKSPTYIWA